MTTLEETTFLQGSLVVDRAAGIETSPRNNLCVLYLSYWCWCCNDEDGVSGVVFGVDVVVLVSLASLELVLMGYMMLLLSYRSWCCDVGGGMDVGVVGGSLVVSDGGGVIFTRGFSLLVANLIVNYLL